MAGVNGVEIKVGQVWRCRDGELRKVTRREGTDAKYPWLVGGFWCDNAGVVGGLEGQPDLIELVKDEKGFTIWHGGEQPVETIGKTVEYRHKRVAGSYGPANRLRWAHTGLTGDIHAYKVVEEAAQADSATLAEETLIALGWTFDGQAWVEQLRIELVAKDSFGAPWQSGTRVRIDMVPNALDVQVGGTHYKDCAIQPIEYIHANKLGFAEGNVVKYITRHRQKHGADDVRKVIHYCQLLLELEYGAGKTEGCA